MALLHIRYISDLGYFITHGCPRWIREQKYEIMRSGPRSIRLKKSSNRTYPSLPQSKKPKTDSLTSSQSIQRWGPGDNYKSCNSCSLNSVLFCRSKLMLIPRLGSKPAAPSSSKLIVICLTRRSGELRSRSCWSSLAGWGLSAPATCSMALWD